MSGLIKSFKKALWLTRKEGLQLNFSKLLLVLSLALGVGSLVALESFTQRIENTVQRDAKTLLAADLQIQAFRPFIPEIGQALSELGIPEDDSIHQYDFVSSLRYNESVTTISTRVLEGKKYPFYGELKTEPQLTIESLASSPLVLVDNIFKSKGLKVGDSVEIGKLRFKVAGFILQEPQSVSGAFTLGPRVLFHRKFLVDSGLTGPGSRIFYQLLIKTPMDPDKFKEAFRSKVPDPHWRIITPEHANRQAGRLLDRLRAFLSFVAVTALLLGALGTYSVFRSIFLKKIDDYLTLRCLGFSGRDIEIFSVLQALPVVAGGFVFGISLGWSLEWLVQQWATQILNMTLSDISRLPTLLKALGLTSFSVFLALYLPTREILKFPVSMAARGGDIKTTQLSMKDATILFLLSSILIYVITQNYKFAFIFIAGILVSGFLFYFSTWVLQKLAPGFSEKLGAYFLKSGLRLFYRGGSQVQIVSFTLGFSVFLMCLVNFSGSSLQSQINLSERTELPNTYFMGIPEDLNSEFLDLFPGIQLTPVVQARIESLKNVAVETDQSFNEDESERFFQTREYFITKRNSLADGERILQGKTLFREPLENKVRLSVEDRFAARLNVKLNDEITIEISGLELVGVIQSIRKASWLNLKPNFLIVVHPDDVAGAPFDSIGLYHAADSKQVENIQKSVANKYPQVSVVDGIALSERLKNIVNQLSTSVSSLSLFCLLSSIFVFMGLTLSKQHEVQKSIGLWKCLGAPKEFILKTYFTETFATGFWAIVIGVMIAYMANLAICDLVFEIPSQTPKFSMLGTVLAVPLAIMLLFQHFFIKKLYNRMTQDLFRDL